MSDHQRQIRVPVRFREDGTLHYFYGGLVPDVEPGTIGELVIPEASLTDPADVRRVKCGYLVEFVPVGAAVRFAVDAGDAPAELVQHVEKGSPLPSADKPHAVAVEMREPAMLRLRAGKPATLEDARCWIPSLGVDADGLSEAYRLVSERFEPNRLSHSGNVFRLGYCRLDKTWCRLDDLRREHEATFDMRESRVGAEVLEALPSRVGAVLQAAWTGQFVSPEKLGDILHRYRRKLQRLHEASDLADVDTAYRLIDECEAMLDSVPAGAVSEYRRLVQAAVTYLIHEDDEESDTQSLVGFDDDALVVRTIAATIERSLTGGDS